MFYQSCIKWMFNHRKCNKNLLKIMTNLDLSEMSTLEKWPGRNVCGRNVLGRNVRGRNVRPPSMVQAVMAWLIKQ